MSHARPYVVAAAVAIFVQGCGGGAEPPAAKSVHDLSTPDSALAALDEAERSIDQALRGSESVTISQSASQAAQVAPAQPPAAPAPQASAQPSSPPAGGQPAKGGRALGDAPKQEAAPADVCGHVCSSLASMVRAADRLCGLTGEGDGQCASARARVKNAAARVHAACPACS